MAAFARLIQEWGQRLEVRSRERHASAPRHEDVLRVLDFLQEDLFDGLRGQLGSWRVEEPDLPGQAVCYGADHSREVLSERP